MPVGSKKLLLTEDEFFLALGKFGLRSFSTLEFFDQIKATLPEAYRRLEAEYGAGGKGAGTFYSAVSRVSHYLDYWARRGRLDKLDYRPAPKHHGSRVIRYWTLDREALGGTEFPHEVSKDEVHEEGSVQQVLVNRYERDRNARQACVEHHGLTCAACEFDFEERYGSHGAGFIHVHHLTPLSKIKKNYKVDPINDLIPVCPNCHAMLHRAKKVLSIAQLKKLLFYSPQK